MATTIITGRDLSLTIDSKSYDAQASTVTLTNENNQQVYEVLDGRIYKTLDKTATLEVEMFADWGAANSLCEAMWTAADTAPDTGLAFSFTADTGAVFTGNVLPAYPPVGGTANDAQTVTLSLVVVDGEVTGTFT
jgi:hypothetical protein